MTESDDQFTNDAFISYNSVDAEFSEQLEHALEHYRAPKNIIPRKVIFRYEGDMVGTNYDEAIKRQLKDSRHLIVVCSPEARASKFVDQEVKLFAQVRSAKYIIPVLLRGQANNEADSEENKAFPRALIEQVRMPIAMRYLGFRPGHSKIKRGDFEKSWYELLANLYEESRETIEQREREKRRRLRTLWSIGSSVVMVAISTLAIIAWIQRGSALKAQAEAEFQRGEALTAQDHAEFQRGEALAAQAEAESQMLALMAERETSPEIALMLAASALRRSGNFASTRSNTTAQTVIFRNVSLLPGRGLAGWYDVWPRQLPTDPWAGADQSGRWLLTGNWYGETALLWDLTQDPIAGSARVFSLPLTMPNMEGIQSYVNDILPEVDGPWLITGPFPGWRGVKHRISNPDGGDNSIVTNQEWAQQNKADGSETLIWENETPIREIPQSLDRFSDYLVTNDNKWLLRLGERTHRLFDLETTGITLTYSSSIVDTQWEPNSQALFTIHDNGEVIRWGIDGSAQSVISLDRSDGTADFIVSEGGHWMLFSHTVGDYSVWHLADGSWVEQLGIRDPKSQLWKLMLSGKRTYSNRLVKHRRGFNFYEDPSSLDVTISELGILSLAVPDGTMYLDLNQPDKGHIVEYATEAMNNQVPNEEPAESNSDAPDYVISPDRKWRVSWEGLQRSSPGPGSVPGQSQGEFTEPAGWSEAVPFPEFGGGEFPRVFFFSKNSPWLVFGLGRFNQCDSMYGGFFRVDLSHQTPLETFSPLRGYSSEQTEMYDCPLIEFSESGDWLMTGSALWHNTEKDAVNPIRLPGIGVSLSPDENWVAVEVDQSNGEKRIMTFPLESTAIAELACRTAGRNLVAEEWRELFPGQPYKPLCEENSTPPNLIK